MRAAFYKGSGAGGILVSAGLIDRSRPEPSDTRR